MYIYIYICMYTCMLSNVPIYLHMYELFVRRRMKQSIASIVFPNSAPAVAYAAADVSAADAVRAALTFLQFNFGLCGSIWRTIWSCVFSFWSRISPFEAPF